LINRKVIKMRNDLKNQKFSKKDKIKLLNDFLYKLNYLKNKLWSVNKIISAKSKDIFVFR
jgi:hypothetical protein